MTDKTKEVLKLALDWIEGNGKYDAAKRIAQTIREALAEQPAQQQACHSNSAESETQNSLTLMDDMQAQQQQEPVMYDKTEMNFFAQNLYDQKMREGKRGHYESMFHVIHQCIKKVAPAQQQEPVAWMWVVDGKPHNVTFGGANSNTPKDWTVLPLYTSSQPAQQEPVAFSCLRCVTPKKCAIYGCSPNTWPSETPPASKPLTDEEIEKVWRRVQANDFHDCVQPFARAIEAKLREKNK